MFEIFIPQYLGAIIKGKKRYIKKNGNIEWGKLEKHLI